MPPEELSLATDSISASLKPSNQHRQDQRLMHNMRSDCLELMGWGVRNQDIPGSGSSLCKGPVVDLSCCGLFGTPFSFHGRLEEDVCNT